MQAATIGRRMEVKQWIENACQIDYRWGKSKVFWKRSSRL
jgi:hypothetical protein